jgi:ankyrin repeat protein
MTFSAQPMTTRGTSTTPPPPLPSSAPLASIGSVRELTEHHEVPSLERLCLANLDLAQALQEACNQNQIELIKILLCNGADPNSLVDNPDADTGDVPILAYACMIGSTSLVRLLLEKGAVPTYEMLEEAFDREHDSIVRLLMSKGVSIDTLQSDGFSLLHFACYHQELKQVERLLKLGSDVNHSAVSGETPLILTFSNPDAGPDITKSIMRTLLAARVEKEKPWQGDTPLVVALLQNKFTAFSLLLEAGADRTVKSQAGWTLLEIACLPEISASIFYKLLDHEGPKLWSSAKRLLVDRDDEQSDLKWNYMAAARPPLSPRPTKRQRTCSINQTI